MLCDFSHSNRFHSFIFKLWIMIVHTLRMCTGDAGPEQSLVLFTLCEASNTSILFVRLHILLYFMWGLYTSILYVRIIYFYTLCEALYTSMLYVSHHKLLCFIWGFIYFNTLYEASILYVRLHILLYFMWGSMYFNDLNEASYTSTLYIRLYVLLYSMWGFIYFYTLG